ncbi:hypothetical protein GQ600_3577 [Phytophthora cactorum]|nr:hypothetical protein GQ600_3577 [Phytophthora cactorum]
MQQNTAYMYLGSGLRAYPLEHRGHEQSMNDLLCPITPMRNDRPLGGNCYSYHNILATMCAEVSSVCTSNSCYSSDGDISYTCYSPYSCSGSYTVPAATIATPTSSSDSNGADNCNSMSLSSCHYAETTATAIILGGSTVFVARFCFPDNTKEPSIKQTVTHRLSSVAWCLYTLVSFASFVQDDGASVTFIDYLCDKNELFGLIDWRKKTAAVRPRWMRACAIAAAFLVTLSLAYLLGTVVYNNESCQSIHTVKYCYDCSCQTYCDGVDIGCTDDCQCRGNNGCGSYRCSGASSEVSTDSAHRPTRANQLMSRRRAKPTG